MNEIVSPSLKKSMERLAEVMGVDFRSPPVFKLVSPSIFQSVNHNEMCNWYEYFGGEEKLYFCNIPPQLLLRSLEFKGEDYHKNYSWIDLKPSKSRKSNSWRGLSEVGRKTMHCYCNTSDTKNDYWNDPQIKSLVPLIDHAVRAIRLKFKGTPYKEELVHKDCPLSYLKVSLLVTLEEELQPAHLDYKIDTPHLERHAVPWIMHIPLCAEGMKLNVWRTPPNKSHLWKEKKKRIDNKNYQNATLVNIPFGTGLVVRGDAPHGGCFGNHGNLRL